MHYRPQRVQGRFRISRVVPVAAIAAALAIAFGGAPASAGGGKAVVTADNYDFKPKRVHIPVGGKVVWKQVQGNHNVTAKRGNFSENFSGGKIKRTFKKPGTWKYICTFHVAERMKGKVVVG
jgi:plastocyanin